MNYPGSASSGTEPFAAGVPSKSKNAIARKYDIGPRHRKRAELTDEFAGPTRSTNASLSGRIWGQDGPARSARPPVRQI